MKKLKPLLLITLVCFLFTSCANKGFYHSPLQGNAATYYAMPTGSDSAKSAIYATGSLSIGGMNENWRDATYTAKAGVHRAHAINALRMYYGVSFVYGTYNVKPYNDFYNDNYLDSTINKHAGLQSFSAYGLNAGFSASVPMGRRGEWRYIGLEGSFFSEAGNYYTFRKSLPDSAVTVVDKNKNIGSLGISTEFIFKQKSLNEFGIKLAAGSYLRAVNYYADNFYGNNTFKTTPLIYFSNTYHFTIQRATTYFQLNLATKAAHFQLGLSYRLL